MIFFKDLIGKQVKNNQDEIIGYARAGIFSKNRKKITTLLCADNEEKDFSFPLTDDILTAEDTLLLPAVKRRTIRGETYSPIRKSVYSLQGEYLGVVSDLKIERGNILSVLMGEREFEIEQVRALGDCILVNVQPATSKKKTKNLPILLGQVLRYNVCNDQGELIFGKGQVITPQTLKTALSCNKLLELTIKSLPLTESI